MIPKPKGDKRYLKDYIESIEEYAKERGIKITSKNIKKLEKAHLASFLGSTKGTYRIMARVFQYNYSPLDQLIADTRYPEFHG